MILFNVVKTRNLDQNVHIFYTIIFIQNRKDEIKNPIRAWIQFLNNKTSNLTKKKKQQQQQIWINNVKISLKIILILD